MESDRDLKSRIFKQPYDQKEIGSDGLLLKVHHTAPGPKGDIRRTRFLHASFSSCNEVLAVADHRGSIFIVDLVNNAFWLLVKLPTISFLSFHPIKKDELLVGTEKHNISLLRAETSKNIGILSGHTEAPTNVSFSSDGNFCLSVASCEGFIWDLRSLAQAHRLNLQPDMIIKQAIFMPVSDNILACFQDDAIHIWAFQSFQCVKQIVPDTWEGHNIRTIAFTRNGCTMVLGGSSRQMVIFTVDDWDAQRVIELPQFVSGVQHVEFLPQSFDSGANKILAVLTDAGSLLFVDLSDDTVMIQKEKRILRNFTCSWSGKYAACGMLSGEVEIYNSMQLLENTITSIDEKRIGQKTLLESAPPAAHPSKISQSKRQHTAKKHSANVTHKIETILDINRLRPILKEFLEYPEQYRSLIWRTVLQLPGNKEPWNSLAQRPLHPAAEALSETNPIQNKVMFNCLRSVISCLAHWSPVFGELPYLPHFVFPFIKVFHSDEFVCFEVAVTLIVNWCQHWFEYLSFPPVNILGMIENILSEHDIGLLTIFCNAGVTSRQYAWSLLSTAFSEVLSSAQWRQLWDHIISNPPWFFLFAIVAYNICCRASIKTCSSKKDFEFFFSNQNPIDMKLFIKKCYELMEKTSDENHPRQYLKTFSPLRKGNYPVFSEFPKFIMNYQKEQRDAIRKEEENILKEQHKILFQRLAHEETCLREKKAHIHAARLLEAEKAAGAALHAEELRLTEKRRQLAALRREFKVQEEESKSAARVCCLEQQVKQRCADLDRLHHQLHSRTKLSGIDAASLNEEVHEQFSRLLAKKQEVEETLGKGSLHCSARHLVNFTVPQDELLHLKQQQHLLSEEIQKLREESSKGTKPLHVDHKLAELDNLHQRVEAALARKTSSEQDFLMNTEHCLKDAHATAKLKKLESEVDIMAQKLHSIRNTNDSHARCRSEEAERKLLNLSEQNVCLEPQVTGEALSLRGLDFYKKEKSAVSAAMELRKSILSGWNAS